MAQKIQIRYSESLGGHTAIAYSIDTAKRTLAQKLHVRLCNWRFDKETEEGKIRHFFVQAVNSDGYIEKTGWAYVRNANQLHERLETVPIEQMENVCRGPRKPKNESIQKSKRG